MGRNRLALAALAIALILFVGLTRLRAHREIGSQAGEAAPLQAQASPVVSPSVSVSPSPSASIQSAIDPKELEFRVPDPATYRAQAIALEKQEGSGLPPVLREFSQRMGGLMEKAIASPAFAAALFDRLQDCAVRDENAIPQARSICAINAIRLGEFHPSALSEKAKSLRSSLSPELKQSVEAMEY